MNFLEAAEVLVSVRERVVRVEDRPFGQQLAPKLRVGVVIIDEGRNPSQERPQPAEAAPARPQRAMERNERSRDTNRQSTRAQRVEGQEEAAKSAPRRGHRIVT